jgi:toxin ParE1/3/4
MARFRISSKAAEDMDNIWIYTSEQWSIDQANKMYDLLRDQILFIAENENSGKPYDEVKYGLRGSILNPFIIFYKMGEDGIVEIERILHQSMDIDQQL